MSMVTFSFLECFYSKDILIQAIDESRNTLVGTYRKLVQEVFEKLYSHNLNCGIFFSAKNAFYTEVSRSELIKVESFFLCPNIVVMSSKDKAQVYWIVKDENIDSKEFETMQIKIAKMLNGVDPSLLRLPGFLNKDWLVRYKKLSDKIYTLKELQSVF